MQQKIGREKRSTEEQIIGFLREAESGLLWPSCAGGTVSPRPVMTSGAASLAV